MLQFDEFCEVVILNVNIILYSNSMVKYLGAALDCWNSSQLLRVTLI